MFDKDGSTHQGRLQHLLYEPQDNLAYRSPVSVTGVVRRDAQVVPLPNERNEWELSGGKLEPDESPEQCVVRAIHPPACPGWAVPEPSDPGEPLRRSRPPS